ncbi:uroporphyrinogen-III C-methyltransferase [Terasakiella sp. SH-1]|uniref:uroporphyrinogen-III C-methyltransferase n=1 Tax=Terasakiella sp. SH-1 TaxID=2560057 RepID=UPI001073D3BD|nr:uroporphyrinogen-III C-methyltransferase [Terasakiella sp. SH-1]
MENFADITFPEFAPATVWLVGAGPGDPKLLTLFAYHALQQANVIVHDALVDPAILALAAPHAKLEAMGKRGGQATSAKQKDITLRLIELARAGHKVLRLKGGDPFVFGRGAEEALPILNANIEVRIIPGISAGIAGSAYAGIPVSDGQSNQVISFVTGHDTSGQVPAVDWQALAKSSPVIVFYMPMKHVDKIQAELLKAGRQADEPVCVVSKATTPEQQTCDTTLGSCVKDLSKTNIKAPALFIIGPTVALRQQLTECF